MRCALALVGEHLSAELREKLYNHFKYEAGARILQTCVNVDVTQVERTGRGEEAAE